MAVELGDGVRTERVRVHGPVVRACIGTARTWARGRAHGPVARACGRGAHGPGAHGPDARWLRRESDSYCQGASRHVDLCLVREKHIM